MDIVCGGWDDWMEINAKSPIRSLRTRACIVWDKTTQRALDVLPEKHNVISNECNNTILFQIQDILFRFKKGNEKGISSNIQTRRAIDFHDHGVQFSLFPGTKFDSPKRIEIVYTINELGTKVDKVMVVARNGKSVIWNYELRKTSSDISDISRVALQQQKSPKELLRSKKGQTKISDKKVK